MNLDAFPGVYPRRHESDPYSDLLRWRQWPEKTGRKVEGGLDDVPVRKRYISRGHIPKDKYFIRTDGDMIIYAFKPFTVNTDKCNPETHTVDLEHCIYIPYGTYYTLPRDENGEELDFTAIERATGKANGPQPVPVHTPRQVIKVDKNFTDTVIRLTNDIHPETEQLYYRQNVKTGEWILQNEIKCNPTPWPDTPSKKSAVPLLEQDFTMEWIDEGNHLELYYKGKTGLLKGQKGKPGIRYHKRNAQVSVPKLMSRIDGNFHIATDDQFVMIVAPPDENGNPLKSGMKIIRYLDGVVLPHHWWHSVPMPVPFRVIPQIFWEKVNHSNANISVDLKEETGKELWAAL